jgi:tetratricopeptide (TPR) repeat protein
VCLCLAPGGAVAKPIDPIERAARDHSDLGAALYKVGRYTDAIAEWQAGYALLPRPQFLLNIGSAHRRLHDPVKALAAFTRFLDEAPPNDPDRPGAAAMVAELRAEVAKLPPSPPPPTSEKPPAPTTSEKPAPTTSERPAVATSEKPAAAAAPGALVAAAPAAPRRASALRRRWWIIPVVTVAAAGIAVGLGLGLTARACSPPGCYDLTSTK